MLPKYSLKEWVTNVKFPDTDWSQLFKKKKECFRESSHPTCLYMLCIKVEKKNIYQCIIMVINY